MDVLLQIDAGFAEGADDYIRTDTGLYWHVTVWIIKLLIRRIVTDGLADLIDRRVNNQFEIRRALFRQGSRFGLLLGRLELRPGPGDLPLASRRNEKQQRQESRTRQILSHDNRSICWD